MDQWRQIGEKRRQDHADRVYSLVKRRSEHGAKEYGEELVGDPLDQAEEENIDSLFYIEWARKKIKELQRRVDRLEGDKGEEHARVVDMLSDSVAQLMRGTMSFQRSGVGFKVTASRVDKGDRPYKFRITVEETT
jgi:hypothetical protein